MPPSMWPLTQGFALDAMVQGRSLSVESEAQDRNFAIYFPRRCLSASVCRRAQTDGSCPIIAVSAGNHCGRNHEVGSQANLDITG